MAKKNLKSFSSRNTLKQTVDNFNTTQETETAIESFENETTDENFKDVQNKIMSDSLLSKNDKQELLKIIDTHFTKIMSDRTLNDMSFEELGEEISFYFHTQRKLTFLIGQRLHYINEKYMDGFDFYKKFPGKYNLDKLKEKALSKKINPAEKSVLFYLEIVNKYESFKGFIFKKFGLQEATGYQYIDYAKYYGLWTSRVDVLPEYTKLTPFITIIRKLEKIANDKAKNESLRSEAKQNMQNIIEYSIDYAAKHNVKEMREAASKKKEELKIDGASSSGSAPKVISHYNDIKKIAGRVSEVPSEEERTQINNGIRLLYSKIENRESGNIIKVENVKKMLNMFNPDTVEASDEIKKMVKVAFEGVNSNLDMLAKLLNEK